MPGGRIVWTGVDRFLAATERYQERMEWGSRVGVTRTAMAVIRQAKINATNPPPRLASLGTKGRDPGTGPAVVTGRLRNSIQVLHAAKVGRYGFEMSVGPTVVYSRRVELGFYGADSRGRIYNQPPYPYLEPAFRFVMAIVAERMFTEAWAEAQAR